MQSLHLIGLPPAEQLRYLAHHLVTTAAMRSLTYAHIEHSQHPSSSLARQKATPKAHQWSKEILSVREPAVTRDKTVRDGNKLIRDTAVVVKKHRSDLGLPVIQWFKQMQVPIQSSFNSTSVCGYTAITRFTST
jgi:hypothetical protein